MKTEILEKLKSRQFVNIWNIGADFDEYCIYWNDGSKDYISEKDFNSVLNIDEQLYDEINIALQN